MTEAPPPMFTHLTVGSNDLARSKRFYDALMAASGGKPGVEVPELGRVMYLQGTQFLIINRPINGEPATVANGLTIGLAVPSAAHVDQWHAAGVANGGTSCEDPPGERLWMGARLYSAYLRDPDGNKLCAMVVLG